MMIGRLILISSILALLTFGTPQSANVTVAVATNFPMPGKGNATQTAEPARHDLELWRERRTFQTDQQTVPFQLLRSAARFRRSDLARTLRFPNAVSSMRQADSCCGDRVQNSQTARRRSRCHFLQNCRPTFDSRLLVA